MHTLPNLVILSLWLTPKFNNVIAYGWNVWSFYDKDSGYRLVTEIFLALQQVEKW
jgi:hypothetical protein